MRTLCVEKVRFVELLWNHSGLWKPMLLYCQNILICCITMRDNSLLYETFVGGIIFVVNTKSTNIDPSHTMILEYSSFRGFFSLCTTFFTKKIWYIIMLHLKSLIFYFNCIWFSEWSSVEIFLGHLLHLLQWMVCVCHCTSWEMFCLLTTSLWKTGGQSWQNFVHSISRETRLEVVNFMNSIRTGLNFYCKIDFFFL